MHYVTVPMTQKEAKKFIEDHHRHHKKGSHGDVFRLAIANVTDKNKIIGVAQIGRPVSRVLQDGFSLEVTRLCINGDHKNACSFVYSRAARIARELGYKRIYTYILHTEAGISLKASGWEIDGHTKGRSWSCKSRPRQSGLFPEIDKVRWVKLL
tara:strand:+ start:126 stop:587 length:462 start_codon:yes stop_codon:yes gene_type:complete